MKRAVLAGAALSAAVLAGCQTSGYTTGEFAQMDCKFSPVQTSWNNAYTPSSGKCFRKAAGGATVNAYEHARPFEIPGGQARVVYTEALTNTYLTYLDVGTTTRFYSNVRDEATNWRGEKKTVINERPYIMTSFEMGGRKCVGFNAHAKPQAIVPGFSERIHGYACANNMDYSSAETFLASLTFDGARASGAPATPTSAPVTTPATEKLLQAPATPPSMPNAQDAGGRLKALKDLFDRKLITQQEYDERRKAIVGTL